MAYTTTLVKKKKKWSNQGTGMPVQVGKESFFCRLSAYENVFLFKIEHTFPLEYPQFLVAH